MKCAFVGLTRGYQDTLGYSGLISRNRAIYEHVNQYLAEQYPVIIFHEGNITEEHQSFILSCEQNRDVRFVSVEQEFRFPDELKEEALREDWWPGYRHMCRFNSIAIWDYVLDFDFIMRVDEDCLIQELPGKDPFAWLQENQLDFAASAFSGETHELTNETLPIAIDAYIKSRKIDLDVSSIYNQRFPYTNLYVTRVAFWRQDVVQDFLKFITSDLNFYYMRWGDLPVLGVSLNMFADPSRVGVLSPLRYYHGSHDLTINQGTGDPSESVRIPPYVPSATDLSEQRDLGMSIGTIRPEVDAALSDFFNQIPSEIGDQFIKGQSGRDLGDLGDVLFMTRLSDWAAQAMRRNLATELLKTALRSSDKMPPSVVFGIADRLVALADYRAAIDAYASVFERDPTYEAQRAEKALQSARGYGYQADSTIIPENDTSAHNVFKRIYETGLWGGGSGPGSHVSCSAKYAGLLQSLVRKGSINSVVDLGCGDWQFSHYVDFSETTYLGVDIVESVVAANNRIFGSPNIQFKLAHAGEFEVPECDLLVCKDALQHMSNRNVLNILSQLGRARYVLLTNDYNSENVDCRDGDTRPLNLRAEPFLMTGLKPVLVFGSGADTKATFFGSRSGEDWPT